MRLRHTVKRGFVHKGCAKVDKVRKRLTKTATPTEPWRPHRAKIMLTRHKPFFLAILAWAIGLVAAWLGLELDLPFAMTIAADMAFLTYLVLTFAIVPRMTRKFLAKHAAADDLPISVIFGVIVAALVTAAIAIFVLINAQPRPPVIQLCLALAALPLGWFTIHLMAANHYAHLFWQPSQRDEDSGEGLEFPGTKEPQGWDFVYFAFVIGMTAQTSDVQITGSHMRRFNLAHAIVSFFFNTVLVAAAVNLAVSLGN
jgi:uncharacterized membrane protein